MVDRGRLSNDCVNRISATRSQSDTQVDVIVTGGVGIFWSSLTVAMLSIQMSKSIVSVVELYRHIWYITRSAAQAPASSDLYDDISSDLPVTRPVPKISSILSGVRSVQANVPLRTTGQ